MKIRNPRTGEHDYEIAPLSPENLVEVATAMRLAQPAWAARDVAERCAILLKLSDAISLHAETIAAALTADTGRAKISHIEVDGTAGLIRRWATGTNAIIASTTVQNRPSAIPGISTSTRLIPYPLVGVISPWNFPMTLALIDAIPALMAGCAVIVKPSEVTPRFIRPLVAALTEVPEIPLMIIEGDGATGAALVPLVDYVAFTGSVATGRKVAMAAAEAFITASLELGGKDPMIILASADPAHAAAIALRASVINSGQACQSIERVYVAREIAEPFLVMLAEMAAAVRLNYPDINSGDIGPFILRVRGFLLAARSKILAAGFICVQPCWPM
ncbi:MAG: aldehyde dehydrogenase family protein [Sphingomonadales bacterium]|nr:aldehyde dehydrogenase family protein [Sphingomonadales bacterium]